MTRSCRGAVAALVALGVALVAVASAQADSKRISDGNDRPGPLDIRSASHGHSGNLVVHTISTFSRWPISLLAPRDKPNLFALEISTDGDRALERVVLIYSRNGSMVARVFRVASGRRLVFIGSASASRPNARTVRVSIRRSLLGNPVAYRWNAHSQYRASGACSDFCSDRAPNSGWVRHDITAPTIKLMSFPAIPPDVEYDVSFRISDEGGAGLRSWRLQHRPFGTSSWTMVESGTRSGLKSHHQVSAEDNDDQFRVVAVDRQGNQRISPIKLVSVPIDDTSASLVYTGIWTHGAGDPLDFRDTLSTSIDDLAEVKLTFTGRYVAWVARGRGDEQDQAEVIIDEEPREVVWFDVETTERRKILWQRTFASVGTRTLRIRGFGYAVPIDGFIVR